jgi:tetratricopeptide (TPR) repeat protein
MYHYERYESAKKALAPIAATDPVANYYMGLAELGLEHVNEAKAVFSKFPEDPANMAGLARVAYISGKAMEGAGIAQAVANKAGKKAWEPLKYAADAINYTDGGNKQQAIDWYKEALKRYDNPETRIALGDAWQQVPGGGGGGEAMNNYEKVTSKDPKNSLAFSRIGKLWYAAKNYTLALENYQKAKEADPTNPKPYEELANAYFWTGKYDLAKQNIEKYLELSDKSVDDQIRYMEILFLAKDYQGAIQRATELEQQGLQKPGIYGIRGYSLLETKEYAKALEYIRKYFQMQDPKRIYPLDYLYFGNAFLGIDSTDSAEVYYQKAIAADTSKNKSDTYRKIAEGFKTAKDYAKSAYWYNKLVAEYPETQALDYFWAGAMYYYAKDYAKAATAFKAMETKYADQPSAIYWQGRVAAAEDEEGKSCIAEPFYTKWLSAVGDNYDKKNDLMYAYQYLALCYYNKGDIEKAKLYLTKIEAIDPANSFAKQLRDAIAAPKGK